VKEQKTSVSNFDLWSLINKINHSISLIRQRELSPYNIATQQLFLLRTIQSLGSKATMLKLANEIDREIGVVSKQTIVLEKDGLIKRIKDAPKSRRLRIELTEKGLDMITIPRESKTIDEALSFLTEEEREQLHSSLNKVLIALKEHTSV
jgi:DNA-binding MarR family transcriptional regulator